MTGLLVVAGYVVAVVVAYVLTVRWTVRKDAHDCPSLEWDRGDTAFAVWWSLIPAFVWPVWTLFWIGVWLHRRHTPGFVHRALVRRYELERAS